ncbi:MAG: hypothetical protein QME63_05410 [Actinomycetota bacterium]|nr:hypothetical protein [Actinomycetota bacterium]
MDELKQSLINQVEFNCDVSDAKYWGYFSICGLLMSLYALYMSKLSLKPWAYVEGKDISEWIAQKEAGWEKLENEGFRELRIHGKSYNPFDISAINQVLIGEGLVYGAGYGLFNKPSFFLADLHSYSKIHGCSVFVSKKEHVRDLFISPGMLREKQIFLRLEPLRAILWDKFQELKKQNNPILEYAFNQYGFHADQDINEEFEIAFEKLTNKYSDVVLYHELSESIEDIPGWSEMLYEIDAKDVNFFLRAVKDMLADTSNHGPIKRSIDNKDSVNLGLSIALIDRYRVKMDKEIRQAYEEFINSGDWDLVENARKMIYAKVVLLRDKILDIRKSVDNKADLIAKIRRLI